MPSPRVAPQMHLHYAMAQYGAAFNSRMHQVYICERANWALGKNQSPDLNHRRRDARAWSVAFSQSQMLTRFYILFLISILRQDTWELFQNLWDGMTSTLVSCNIFALIYTFGIGCFFWLDATIAPALAGNVFIASIKYIYFGRYIKISFYYTQCQST